MKKFAALLPTIIPILTLIASLLDPAVGAFWANHATAASTLAPLAVILAHFMPSPMAQISK